jgi:hypothetical protein
MPEVLGFELGNSAKSIDCEIWTIGGALPRIVELMAQKRAERYAAASSPEHPAKIPGSRPSAEALLDLVMGKSPDRDDASEDL